MDKGFLQSKTIWGLALATLLGIANIYNPSEILQSLIIASLGFAGYGIRDAL